MNLRWRAILCCAVAVTTACGGDEKPATADAAAAVDAGADTDAAAIDVSADATASVDERQAKLLAIPQTETWLLAGLSDTVHVVRTEGDVPHIYAKNRKDLAHVMGFVMARHRYFQMELTRRFGLGTLTELLGDAALSNDQSARANGSAFVAVATEERLTAEEGEVFDGFAAGINDYIAQTLAGKLPEPSEFLLAKIALGKSAKDLMKPWDRHAVAGAAAAMIYNLGYETDDVGRTAHIAALSDKFTGKPLGDLRKAGAIKDIAYHVAPIKPVSSAPGLGLDLYGKNVIKSEIGKVPSAKAKVGAASRPLPKELLARAIERDRRWQKHSGHDRTNGFGSNSWAAAGTGTKGGVGIVAGDGHLPLSIPSLFYQIGLDDSVFGGAKADSYGGTHQMGLVIPGLPMMAVGTNGSVGWSQTQLSGDITDWYRDELSLDAAGLPKSTKFLGEDRPLIAIVETFVIADAPTLGSVGRTEKTTRWTTADGRWITDIEGPAVDPKTYKPAAGESVVSLSGKHIVPKDTDKDGKITAISFDFTGLDKPAVLHALDLFGHSKDVFEFRDATRWLMAYSQNIVAADSAGHVLYTGYQSVPCRGYLPRDKDGLWLPGADPKQLIDGSKYPGFTIPTLADGRIDESQGKDPTRCVVPFDESPQSIDPPQGFVVTGNNDPGNLSTDDNLHNDKWYLGGPWANGYRADTIAEGLKKAVAGKNADVAALATIQAANGSRLGDEWVPFLLQAADQAKALIGKDAPTEEEARVVALYQSITPTVRDEALARLKAWHAAGSPAPSGVATFYHAVQPGETEHAVATSIFNGWFGAFIGAVFNDEGANIWEPWGADGQTRALSWLRDGRGAGNPKNQASWNPATQESAFFDVLSTPPIESSREMALLALEQGLGKMAQKDGGFGSSDMATWIWGLRHGVHFDSLLADFLGSSPQFAALAEQFSITPQLEPMQLTKDVKDPRYKLTQFPRGGDAFAVDAAGGINNNGYGSGPVFRMVIAMGKDANGKDYATGQNIIPGGQSGLTDSPNFYDQARLWLANETWPLRFEVADVVAGAKGREVYSPK